MGWARRGSHVFLLLASRGVLGIFWTDTDAAPGCRSCMLSNVYVAGVAVRTDREAGQLVRRADCRVVLRRCPSQIPSRLPAGRPAHSSNHKRSQKEPVGGRWLGFRCHVTSPGSRAVPLAVRDAALNLSVPSYGRQRALRLD